MSESKLDEYDFNEGISGYAEYQDMLNKMMWAALTPVPSIYFEPRKKRFSADAMILLQKE